MNQRGVDIKERSSPMRYPRKDLALNILLDLLPGLAILRGLFREDLPQVTRLNRGDNLTVYEILIVVGD